MSNHLSFSENTERYVVKIAETSEELVKALHLRNQVFYRENPGVSPAGALDWDQYDRTADHLIICDKTNGEVVGTYRLMTSEPFESASFYDLSSLVKGCARPLEMSCACVARQNRSGGVVALLWRGLAHYIDLDKTDFVFGMASLRNLNPEQLANLERRLQRAGFFSERFFCETREDRRIAVPENPVEFLEKPENVLHDLPPLFRAYLKVGARVASRAAHDAELKCTHFLMAMPTESFSERVKEHYFRACE